MSRLRTITIDPNEPVVIRTCPDAYTAEMARLALHAAGIPCMLLGNTYLGAADAVRLAVRRDDATEAVAALEADTAADHTANPDAPAG